MNNPNFNHYYWNYMFHNYQAMLGGHPQFPYYQSFNNFQISQNCNHLFPFSSINQQQNLNNALQHQNTQNSAKIQVYSQQIVQKQQQCPHKKQEQKKMTDKNIQKNQKLATRNVLPNAVHQILTYVRRKHKSGKAIKRILKSHCKNQQFTEERYYNYQSQIKDSMGHYLKKNSLQLLNRVHDPECHVYSMEEQKFYLKVSRMLALYFINYELIPLLITSSRINKGLMIQHLSNRRKISEIFIQILDEQKDQKMK